MFLLLWAISVLYLYPVRSVAMPDHVPPHVQEKQHEVAECDVVKDRCKLKEPKNMLRRRACVNKESTDADRKLECVSDAVHESMRCAFVTCFDITHLPRGFINVLGKCICGDEPVDILAGIEHW